MTANAKILVVDDEMPIRYTMQKTLARDGYQVTAVESGEQALQHLATQEFDLALIDLRLKGMDGLELLAELRRKCPATTVIILTAHASLETAVQALRQGAHDYLFKPCATVELRESVRTGLLKRHLYGNRRCLYEPPGDVRLIKGVPSRAGSRPPRLIAVQSSERGAI